MRFISFQPEPTNVNWYIKLRFSAIVNPIPRKSKNKKKKIDLKNVFLIKIEITYKIYIYFHFHFSLPSTENNVYLFATIEILISKTAR